MVTIVDDYGDSIETNVVLYDLEIGKFIRFEVEDDMLYEIDVFSGNTIHELTVDEFKQECMADEYRTLPDKALENPSTVLEEVLNAVLTGAMDSCAGYEPWEVRFAQNSCSFEKVDLK